MGSDVAGSGLPWVDAIAQSFEPYSFEESHEVVLPALIARNQHLVVDDLRGATPLSFRVGDRAFTWIAGDGDIKIIDGDTESAASVLLSEATFSEFLHELLTASGAVRTGRAEISRGVLAGWQRWEPAIRSLCSGREIYSPAVWETLVDSAGNPLDLHRTFTVADDADEMRHFLEAAGYLHIRAVFTREEVEHLAAEVEHVRAKTTPGDPFSWWSVNRAGDEVVTRINYLGRHSSVLQELSNDTRLALFARLANPEVRVCDDRLDGPMVFVKSSNVIKGNADLGWHVDDGIGGHPVMCPLIQAGIQLDHANPANGQLLVLAGSHRYTKHWIAWGEEGDLPAIPFETEPGDLTVHYGDTMHTTPPPIGDDAGRRALYYKFAEPKTFDWIPAACHYNDALFRADSDGRVGTRATTWHEAGPY